jgi:hypothetical protein
VQDRSERIAAVRRLYAALDALQMATGGFRRLADATAKGWPTHGVYFFFDEAEPRSTSGDGPRCVRVGTHGLHEGAKSTLWKRLRHHRGHADGGGAHRTSVFRRLVGRALIARDGLVVPSWCEAKPPPGPNLDAERDLERRVSEAIRELPVIALPVADREQRNRVERVAIALLSNAGGGALFDPPSTAWLGRWSSNAVRCSGLWNQMHVGAAWSAEVLDEVERLVEATCSGLR